jgi:hypothetical protein
MWLDIRIWTRLQLLDPYLATHVDFPVQIEQNKPAQQMLRIRACVTTSAVKQQQCNAIARRTQIGLSSEPLRDWPSRYCTQYASLQHVYERLQITAEFCVPVAIVLYTLRAD